jgi:hypothetical protein
MREAATHPATARAKENCLRFANPAEALGGRHLEAQRQGGLKARRLQDVGLEKFWMFLMVS